MHNLSTYFLELKSVFDNDKNNNSDNNNNLDFKYNQKYSQNKRTINGIEYYVFLLINIKKEIHCYYTPSLQIYKEWINGTPSIIRCSLSLLVTKAQELFFQKKKEERRQGKVSVDIDMTTAYLYVLNQYREFEFHLFIDF